MGWSTNDIAAELINASSDPAAFHRVNEQVQALPLDVKKAVYARLADTTPNPTGDR
jgi:hypothetical protein